MAGREKPLCLTKRTETLVMNINLNSQTACFTLTNSLNAQVSELVVLYNSVQRQRQTETNVLAEGIVFCCAFSGFLRAYRSNLAHVSVVLASHWMWEGVKGVFSGCVSEGKVNTGSAIFHCWGCLGKESSTLAFCAVTGVITRLCKWEAESPVTLKTEESRKPVRTGRSPVASEWSCCKEMCMVP